MQRRKLVLCLLSVLVLMSMPACTRKKPGGGEEIVVSGERPMLVMDDEKDLTSSPGFAQTDPPRHVWTVDRNIVFRLSRSEYPANSKTFTMVIENRSQSVLQYWQGWTFEKLDGDTWRTVRTIEDLEFPKDSAFVERNTQVVIQIPTWFLDEPFTAGLYRITGTSLRTGKTVETLSTGGEYTAYEQYKLELRIVDISN